MPWTKKQIRLAEAIKHGFQPTGKAEGFSNRFADQVIAESEEMDPRRKKAEERMGKGAHAAPKR